MLIAGIAQNVDLPMVWWFSFLFIYFSVHFFFSTAHYAADVREIRDQVGRPKAGIRGSVCRIKR